VLNVVLGSYKALTDSILSYLVKSDTFRQMYGFKIEQTLKDHSWLQTQNLIPQKRTYAPCLS
jgi:hypothetical protein